MYKGHKCLMLGVAGDLKFGNLDNEDFGKNAQKSTGVYNSES